VAEGEHHSAVKEESMIIMGIDPSSTVTGFGLIQHEDGMWRAIRHGCIRTKGAHSLPEKLEQIYSGLREVISEHHPDVVVVEKSFSGKNLRTALVMGQVLGVSLLAAARASLPVSEYSPREVKLAVTGFGSASKEQVQHWVRRLLRFEEDSLASDASDALAVALCHANRLVVPET
jgi:crossover junction endodeoxyribonuclease RuvC